MNALSESVANVSESMGSLKLSSTPVPTVLEAGFLLLAELNFATGVAASHMDPESRMHSEMKMQVIAGWSRSEGGFVLHFSHDERRAYSANQSSMRQS